MIRQLMAGQERLSQFTADLKVLGWTLVEIATFGVCPRKPRFSYPQRCQHCAKSIRLASEHHPSASEGVYRASDGSYSCDGTIRLRHTPMPAVPGRETDDNDD